MHLIIVYISIFICQDSVMMIYAYSIGLVFGVKCPPLAIHPPHLSPTLLSEPAPTRRLTQPWLLSSPTWAYIMCACAKCIAHFSLHKISYSVLQLFILEVCLGHLFVPVLNALFPWNDSTYSVVLYLISPLLVDLGCFQCFLLQTVLQWMSLYMYLCVLFRINS